MTKLARLFILFSCLWGCDSPWNNPYPDEPKDSNTLYSAFLAQYKHLDPAQSYEMSEGELISEIYEPPLQYHYLKRPYELIPLGAASMPVRQFLDAQGQVTEDPSKIVFTEYKITIAKHRHFQPHPAFAQSEAGYLYHHLPLEQAKKFKTIKDFKQQGSREVTADDYVYQIKRLADPTVECPIFGIMSEYIVGLKELRETLRQAYHTTGAMALDLRNYPLEGVRVNGDEYTIRLKGQYPQFIYWLASSFFVPMPWESTLFYGQEEFRKHNISLDWYPIGTGAFMMTENNPNRRIELVRNPNFHEDLYPSEGTPEDEALGRLRLAGQRMPFIDRVVLSLEKEVIPYWNKFLQGYYDRAGVSQESFDQAFSISDAGVGLSDSMKQAGITMNEDVAPSVMYWGFNMLDPLVGGSSEKNKKLRQAISIAMDVEEYISIFLNGNAVMAQSPIPPGVFGYNAMQTNPVVYQPSKKRHSLDKARQLLTEAGYEHGRDPKTNMPLILNFDAIGGGNPDAQARMEWMREQFSKLGIVLIIRSTQYSRFQDIIASGEQQIFQWGWSADYPDPENFFKLLYSHEGRVHHQGQNECNYSNPEFDKLFESMRAMENGPEREAIVSKMIAMLQEDAPWIWGYYPITYILSHQWMNPTKPSSIIMNNLKYVAIDTQERAKHLQAWNHPVRWPLWAGLGVLFVLIPYGWVARRRYEERKVNRGTL